ncbi:MAG: HAMP domain-containing histidine kinase [bacterium]|nr:MAG: HAMP domain-containing histidine kinase [bacterium]
MAASDQSILEAVTGLQDSAFNIPDEIRDSLLHLYRDYLDLRNGAAIRRQIDLFLGESADKDQIIALTLTIATTGQIFGFNRAFLLLDDPTDGSTRGAAGVGPLSRLEAGPQWHGILEEGLDFEKVVRRAIGDFDSRNRHLAPLLEGMVFLPDGGGDTTSVLWKRNVSVVNAGEAGSIDEGIFSLLDAGQIGVLPLWGQRGHFGAITVDNFANGREITLGQLEQLDAFLRPFTSSLEKSLLIEGYRIKVKELEETRAILHAREEMLIRMERRAALNRYTTVLAHNLKNPLMSMAGHLRAMETGGADHEGSGTGESSRALREGIKKLDDFVGDFVSQVQEDHPSSHYWDVNHIIGDVIRALGDYRPLDPVTVVFEEGGVPLAWVDYDLLTSVIRRIVGLMVSPQLNCRSLRIATAADGDELKISVEDVRDRPDDAVLPERYAAAIRGIEGRLARERIRLQWDGLRFVLRIALR